LIETVDYVTTVVSDLDKCGL